MGEYKPMRAWLCLYPGAFSLFCLLAVVSLRGAEPSATPLPTVQVAHITSDFAVDGGLAKPVWQKARPVRMDRATQDAKPIPKLATTVRVLWSDRFLYLGYHCPFTQLSTFEPAELDKERFGLWDRDVVETFINADPANLRHYTEFELSPNGEELDLVLKLPDKDFKWSSRFETAVKIDPTARVWTAEMKIPLSSLSETKPKPGTRWRINFYRHDAANNAFLAWSPTFNGNFHTPERFGVLVFGE